MKYLIALLPFWIVLLPVTLTSQWENVSPGKEGFYYGVTGGANLSTLKRGGGGANFIVGLSTSTVSNTETTTKPGFQLYAIGGIGFWQKIELEAGVGILYSQSAYQGTITSTSSSILGPNTTRTFEDTISQQSLWLEIPIIFRWRIAKGYPYFLGFGSAIARPLVLKGTYSSSSFTTGFSGNTYESGKIGKKETQLSFLFSFGLYLPRRYTLAISFPRRVVYGNSSDKFPVPVTRLNISKRF